MPGSYCNERGCATPFETFIVNIIRWTTWGNAPTPDELIEQIGTEGDGYGQDYELTVHSIKRFMQNHPNAISEIVFPPVPLEPPAVEQPTQPAAGKPAKTQATRRKKVNRAAA